MRSDTSTDNSILTAAREHLGRGWKVVIPRPLSMASVPGLAVRNRHPVRGMAVEVRADEVRK